MADDIKYRSIDNLEEQTEGVANMLVPISVGGTAKKIKGETLREYSKGDKGDKGDPPTIQITNIPGGHRVTFIDDLHPEGQSFDVLNGDGAGDMTANVYDPAGKAKQIAVEGEAIRRNLLDNWYFGNPVNQRGQTSYTGSGYSIDRWRMWDNSGVLSIVSGGISYVSDNDKLFSYLPNSPFKNGDTITISALINGNLITATGQKASDIVDINSSGDEIRYYEANETSNFSIGYAIKGFDSSTIISAVKLELGNTQTLAHQENGVWVLNEIPDYGEELLKCQRYYQLYRTESMRPTFSADCRPVMRTEPVQDTLTIDNVTYYTNSAEL